ncbi:4'-phosphopantetheinyl transferase family protein [Caenibacillus caldisaponilyticus]|uniref:4'-phosphopantetheinyl transferase family protein n=1 Tax=Caenibacillus caldisaponilyticus TaxID=1674942 RepID=UPI0013015072|nr:4'-phosphopantetheinyl transferase superfamily protein [Caenibacillus caldisaponilyticus]
MEVKTIKIYFVILPKEIPKDILYKKVSILDINERKIFERYRTKDKKIEFLTGRILAKNMISKEFNTSNRKISFYKNSFGKLFVERDCIPRGKPPIYFNLSHSNGIVTCAISSNLHIGIDVENIKQDYLDIMEQIYLPKEIEFVNNGMNKNDKLRRFYLIWTLKESLTKALGLGLSLSLKSFKVPLDFNGGKYMNFVFKTFIVNDYIISVAVLYKKGVFYKFTLKKLSWKKLFCT